MSQLWGHAAGNTESMKTSNDTITNQPCQLLIGGTHNDVLAVNDYSVICCVVCNWWGKEPYSGRRMDTNTCNFYIFLPVCSVIRHLVGSFHCLYRRFCDWVCRWNNWWSRVSASHETETRKEGWKLLLPDSRKDTSSWSLHLIVVRRFEYADDPESYASGSVATGRASHAGKVKG